MNYYDDDDREKPSWRDIDKMKDRGGRAKERRDEQPRPKRTTYAKMQYKKKLEEFFSVGKKKEDKVKLEELKKVKDIKNRNAYMKAADEFIKKYGMPKDLDFLLSMLDHRETENVCKSLELIEQMYKDETETRQDIIKQKVHILEMTASDPKVQGMAEEILSRMKS